jgi:hypothetical protein
MPLTFYVLYCLALHAESDSKASRAARCPCHANFRRNAVRPDQCVPVPRTRPFSCLDLLLGDTCRSRRPNEIAQPSSNCQTGTLSLFGLHCCHLHHSMAQWIAALSSSCSDPCSRFLGIGLAGRFLLLRSCSTLRPAHPRCLQESHVIKMRGLRIGIVRDSYQASRGTLTRSQSDAPIANALSPPALSPPYDVSDCPARSLARQKDVSDENGPKISVFFVSHAPGQVPNLFQLTSMVTMAERLRRQPRNRVLKSRARYARFARSSAVSLWERRFKSYW